MPDMQPVANTGIQPNPLGSISNILGIQSAQLGIQQQRQALQTGQYQQAAAQAESQQAQQRNKEYQAAQQVAVNGAQSGKYTKPDGSLDRLKLADDITTAAPTYGQSIVGQLLSQANEIVANKQALQNLNASQRSQVGSTLGALATKPDVSSSDVIDTLSQLSEQNPAITRMAISFSHAIPPNATPQQLQQFLQRAALSTTSPGEAVTASTPVQSTNAAGQIQNVNRLTGARTMPELGPGATNPTGPQVAGQTVHQTGTANIDVDRANTVTSMANNAPGAITLSQEIDSLADQIGSGKINKAFSSAASALGIDPISYARQVLNKDLGQLKTIAATGAGTDAKMGTILSGYPDDTSATQTIHTAMDYIRGSFRRDLARGQNAEAYAKEHPDMAGFQHSDNALSQSTDPLMYEFRSLPPNERANFYRRNFATPEAAQEFKNKVNGTFHGLGQ